MDKWEHLCVHAPHTAASDGGKTAGHATARVRQVEDIMNALGAEGWELVGVLPAADALGGSPNAAHALFGVVLYFKRRVA